MADEWLDKEQARIEGALERDRRRRRIVVLSWVGIIGGTLGGLLWGILALRSYNRWESGRIDKPVFALVLGWLMIAIVLAALIYAALA
jgi:ABC-type transport system involved in cytochrome c biogenesis permease subunit